MKKLYLPSLCSFLLILGSCAERPLFPELLELELPALPETWAELEGLEFLLSYRGVEGLQRGLRALPGSRLSILVEEGRPQAILALPFFRGKALKPAGAFYPRYPGEGGGPPFPPGQAWKAFLPGGRLLLDWRAGWLASLHRAIEAGGRDPASYDLRRLGKEAAARLSDPWCQDPRELAASLVSGGFRADRLRELPPAPVFLPGPGPWAPESPLAPAPRAGEGGFIAELCPGLRRFYGKAGELEVLVFEDGSSRVLAFP